MYDLLLPCIYMIVGLTMIVLATLMKNGSLKRNRLVGIRVPSVMASDEVWTYVHMKAAPRFVALGIVCFYGAILMTIPLLFPGLLPTWVLLTIALVQIVVVLVRIAFLAMRDAKLFSRNDEYSV